MFYLIGTLPIAAAPETVQRGIGPALVIVNTILLAALVVSAFLFAVAELRVSSLIVAAGMVFLFAPFVVQDLPSWLKDNKLGLVLMLSLTISALATLYFAGAISSVRELITI